MKDVYSGYVVDLHEQVLFYVNTAFRNYCM